MKLIITHPRNAHHDDVLCIAYLMEADTVIERREPAEDELRDSKVYVVDVGMQWDKALNNYDHHQPEGVPESNCAFSLVLKSQGLYEIAHECWPWLEYIECDDTGGPGKLAATYGLARDTVSRILDPVGAFVISLVREQPTIMPGTFVHDLLLQFGRQLRSQPKRFAYEFDLMDKKAKRSIVESRQGTPIPYIDFSGIDENCDLQDSWIASRHPDALCYVYNSDGNLALRRTQKAETKGAINFTLARGLAGVAFIHNTGFLAKLKNCSMDVALEVMAKAHVE
jgi:hypothetical protein